VRGKRLEDQACLLRDLSTQRSVRFDGDFDHIHGAGIALLTVQRPRPVWLGGVSADFQSGSGNDPWLTGHPGC